MIAKKDNPHLPVARNRCIARRSCGDILTFISLSVCLKAEKSCFLSRWATFFFVLLSAGEGRVGKERKEAISVRMGSNTNRAGWSQSGWPPRAQDADKPLCSTRKALLIGMQHKPETTSELCCGLIWSWAPVLQSHAPTVSVTSLSLQWEESLCLQTSNCRAALHITHTVRAHF